MLLIATSLFKQLTMVLEILESIEAGYFRTMCFLRQSIFVQFAYFHTIVWPHYDIKKTNGYKKNIEHWKIQAKRKNSWNKNILWYNSPYSVNVATNVGKEFFQLIGKHLPPHHRLHKIMNRNCIKMSCSMPNIGDIISMQNKATLHQSDRKTQEEDKQCNCRDPSTCPIERKCKEGPIVYKATLTSQNKLII